MDMDTLAMWCYLDCGVVTVVRYGLEDHCFGFGFGWGIERHSGLSLLLNNT